MPCDMTRYPANWPAFRIDILARAQLQCECTGQCGIHQAAKTARRCQEFHHQRARWAKGTIRLGIAHLCTCDPPCAIPGHVIAACQRCHLRIDRFTHAKKRLITQATK